MLFSATPPPPWRLLIGHLTVSSVAWLECHRGTLAAFLYHKAAECFLVADQLLSINLWLVYVLNGTLVVPTLDPVRGKLT